MTFDKLFPKGRDGDFLASTMGTSTGSHNPPVRPANVTSGGDISNRSTLLDGLLTGSSTVVGSSNSRATSSTIREGPTPARFTLVHADDHGTGPSPSNAGSNRDPPFAIDILTAPPAASSSTPRHITRPPPAISSRTLHDVRPLTGLLTNCVNNNISLPGATVTSPTRNDPQNMYTIQNNNMLSSRLNSSNLAFDNNTNASPLISPQQQMLMLERMIMASSQASPVTYHTPFPALSQQYHQHGPNRDYLLSSSLFDDHHRLVSPLTMNNSNTYGGLGLIPMTQSLQSSPGFPVSLSNRMMLNDPQIMSRINQFSRNGGGGADNLVDVVTANTRFIQDLLSSSARLSSIANAGQDYLMSRDRYLPMMQVDDYHQQFLAPQERSYQREGGGSITASSNTIAGVPSPDYVFNLNNHGSSSSLIPMVTAAAAVAGTNTDDASGRATNINLQPKQDHNQKRAFSSLTNGTTDDDDMNGTKDDDDSAPRPAHNSSPKKKQKQIAKKSDHDDERSQPSSSSSSHHDDDEQSPHAASINNKKSSSSKATKKNNKMKKGDGEASEKTRTPLNAYNFFFSDERERIIQSLLQTGKLPDEQNIDDELSNSNTTKKSGLTDEERKKKLLEHIEHRRSIKAKGRPHRKTHGVISFRDLASEISARWKRLLPHRVQYYQELAEMDRNLFRREQMMSGKKEQKKTLSGGLGDNESKDSS